MSKIKSYISKSFHTLNLFLFIVFFSFMIDPVIFNVFLARKIQDSIIGVMIFVALTFLRLLSFCGIYGAIIEIVSGQHIVLTFQNISRNIRRYWKVFLCFSVFRLLLNYILFSYVFTTGLLSPYAIDMLISPFFLMIIVSYLVHDKYQREEIGQKQTIFFELLFLIIVATMVNSILLALASEHFLNNFLFYRLEMFCLKYVHWLMFVYLSNVYLFRYTKMSFNSLKRRELYLIAPAGNGVFMGVASLFVKYYYPALRVLNLLTPPNYTIREFNQIFWRKRYFASNKLIAITCLTSNAPEAYAIAKGFRQRGSQVVMGGAHVTFLPEEALEYCDSVVIGEAESVWEEILQDYENGKLRRIYKGNLKEDYFAKTYANHEDLTPIDISRYIQTGRGCKFNCDFCVIPAIAGKKVRKAPLEEVIRLIALMKEKISFFLFLDDNIIVDKEYAKALFEALIPLKVKWGSSCSIDIAKDDELLSMAKQSGCKNLLIGYEIADTSILSTEKGKFSMAKDYYALTKKIKKIGIGIKAYFIFGFDSDNFQGLVKLWIFCFKLFPNTTIITFLTPLPGSELFYEFMRENRIVNLNWRNFAINRLVTNPRQINRKIYNFFFPLIYFVFLTTTSSIGFCILVFIIALSFLR